MGKIYYLFSIVLIFFSVQPVLSQTGCSDLEITAVENGSVCGGGSVTLKATGSGTGDEILWYDASTGGVVVGIGDLYSSPNISSTTSYWATEVLVDGGSAVNGETETDYTAGSSNSLSSVNSVVTFAVENTNSVQITITDIENYLPANTTREHALWYHPTNISGLPGDISTANGWIQATSPQVATSGSTIGVYPIFENISVTIPANTTYRFALEFTGNISGANTFYYWGSNATPASPNSFSDEGVNLLVGSHTAGGSGAVGYGGAITGPTNVPRAFNGKIKFEALDVLCESPRKEVVASVNNNADEDIASLPYTHSENTETYDNNYTGAPGSDCGATDDYLNGYDVVYKYTADDDYVLTVSLDSISEQYSAVFVYESCADIGDSCAAEGSVAKDSTDSHGFDMLVEDGETYYFVVSSADPTESFDYTLNINGYGCNDIPAPTASDTSPYFMAGDFLSSLEQYVDVLRLSQGVKWYSDSSLTTEITDPDNELLVDGKSYYITQEVIGCEGDALELTPKEFDCSVLSPNVLTPTIDLCVPGGYAVLESETSAAGDEVFWYEKQSDTVAIHKGNTLDVGYIENTTSYWVTEARMTEGELGKQAKEEPIATTASSLSNYGLQFDVTEEFVLVSVDVYPTTAGVMDLELRDASGTVLEVISGINIPSGNGETPYTVELNLTVPVGEGLRLLKTNSTPTMVRESTGNTYPYPIGEVGEITGGALNQGSNLAAYYWFYNWTIIGDVVLCESDKVEVEVIISDDIPEAPEVERNYTFCGVDTYTLADIEVEGDQLVWYDRAGNELEETTEVEDGKTYYVVDKSGGCVSEIAEVYVSIREISELPIGNTEQEFTENQTLADLEVTGVQLKWYADIDKEEPLDIDTKLEDKATYYVSQTKSGHCESEALGVTVTLVLGVDNFNFESFEYFPNPVENQMTLQNEKEIQSVEVYDMQGRAVIMQNNIHKNIVNIDFENISTGNYLMKVFVEDSMRTVHIIKK